MTSQQNKPSDHDVERGGFNPAPAKPESTKEQVGPLPSDDPEHSQRKTAGKAAQRKSRRGS